MIELTEEERSFLQNQLMYRFQDASIRDVSGVTLRSIIGKLVSQTIALTDQENAYIQIILQEIGEINGRLSSTANEKQPIKLGMWRPQVELGFVTSIGAKIGMSIGPFNMPAPDEIDWRTGPIQNQ